MADIEREISAFKEAVYGSEVRGSMVSLAEKLNAEGEKTLLEVAETVQQVEQAIDIANDASASAVKATEKATEAVATANAVNKNAAGFAKEAKSWAIGGTGSRSDEDTDNSKFYASASKSEADRAKIEAEKAASYADMKAPEFYVDLETMVLYMKAGVGIDFRVFHDNELYWKIA